MKRFITRLIMGTAGSLSALGFFAGTVTAVPDKPEACGATTNTIEATSDAKIVKGTANNDYIVVSGDRNSVKGGGGSDCILVTGDSNLVKGENGADVIVGSGLRNYLQGNASGDTIDDTGRYTLVDGGAGEDTCSADPDTSAVRNCENLTLQGLVI